MADRTSSTAASPSNPTQVSVSSTSDDPVPGNDAGSEYIDTILVLSHSNQPLSRRQCESGYVLSWIPTSQIWRTQPTIQNHAPSSQRDLLHQAFQICGVPPFKVRLQYDQSSHLRIDFGTHLEEHGPNTNLTSTRTEEPASTHSQMPDRATKQDIGVASRFAQMLLKKLPDYFDSPNPVKVALTIVKAIIEIKDVGRSLCISSTR